MRVIIILAAIAFTHGAKLERTYLPPSNARTAGGSGSFLQTPLSGATGISGSANIARNSYQETQARFAQSGNDYSQSGNGFDESGKDYFQSGNEFTQSANGFAQPGAEYNNVNNFANELRPERPRAAFERNAAILRQDNSNDGENFAYAFETENGIYAEENGVAINGVEAQGGYSYTGDDGQVYSVRYTADQNGFVPQGDHLPTPPPVPEEILKALEQNARDEAAGIYDDGSYNEGKYAAADSNEYNNQINYQQNNAFNGNDEDTVVTNSALGRSGNAPAYNARNAPAYNARNGPAYNARNVPAYNAPNAPAYGAPDAQNDPSFNAANTIAPSYGAPTQNTYNTASVRNGPSFNVLPSITPSYNAPANNAPSNNAFSGVPRNSATEKAYLPPFADQREQARNGFGRRQQNFDARTGYKY